MIDRALESVSAPYKLIMRILLFFDQLCSSNRSRDIHIFSLGRGVYLTPCLSRTKCDMSVKLEWYTWSQLHITLCNFCVTNFISF